MSTEKRHNGQKKIVSENLPENEITYLTESILRGFKEFSLVEVAVIFALMTSPLLTKALLDMADFPALVDYLAYVAGVGLPPLALAGYKTIKAITEASQLGAWACKPSSLGA